MEQEGRRLTEANGPTATEPSDICRVRTAADAHRRRSRSVSCNFLHVPSWVRLPDLCSFERRVLSKEFFAELFHLGSYDVHAVRLGGIVSEILLMIILRLVKAGRRLYLSHDWPGPDFFRIDLADHFSRHCLLCIIVIENHRPVLRTRIV